MAETKPTARRSYGTGSLYTRTDSVGREAWYGKWRAHGRQVKRRIGPKRGAGARDGLTRRQAEAELRRLIAETPVTASVGERLTIEEVGKRYLRHLENGAPPRRGGLTPQVVQALLSRRS